jgi:hypothetical protein
VTGLHLDRVLYSLRHAVRDPGAFELCHMLLEVGRVGFRWPYHRVLSTSLPTPASGLLAHLESGQPGPGNQDCPVLKAVLLLGQKPCFLVTKDVFLPFLFLRS